MSEIPAPVKYGPLAVTKLPLKEGGEHVYAAAYSPDGKFLAVTFGNGCVRIFDGETFQALQRAKLGTGFDDSPSTGVAWRPPHEETETGIYELVTVSSAGGVFSFIFDVTEGTDNAYLDKSWKHVEEGNETASVDYSPDGALVVTAGSDRILRLYDANTKKFVAKLEKGKDDAGHMRPAHPNRIFSVKFVTPQFIVSGGWEAPVQVWDVRSGFSERQITGAAISSDGIETTPGSQQIMVVSKRDSKQLQVFDFLSGREVEKETEKLTANVGPFALITVRYSPDAAIVWTATTKPDELLCIDANTGAVKGKVDGGYLGSILCLQRSPSKPKRLVVGAMREGLYVIDCE